MRSRAQHGSALSARSAFVVHFSTERSGRRRFLGRVEHLASGESTHFTSLAALLAFFDRLRSDPAPEQP
jgi:hypothetical protein